MDDAWSDKQELLLMKWAEKAAGNRWLHNLARSNYKKTYDRLSYPTIIVSSITGVGGFAVLNPSSDEASPETHKYILITQYCFAFMNVIGGILTSILKFSNNLELSEQHSAMCIRYSKFYRNIDMELSLEKNNRMDPNMFIAKCRKEYDKLSSDSPNIPFSCIKVFNESFPLKEIKPDVCYGMNVMSQHQHNLEPNHKPDNSLEIVSHAFF